MPVLVTGAAGLIGSHIVRNLLDRGETVIAVDRDFGAGRLDDLRGNDRLKPVQANVTDRAALVAAMQQNGVDRVIHTAALLLPQTETDPLLGVDININGCNNVFEAARLCGVKRVVYPSSISIYGDQSEYGDGAIDENSWMKPWSLYSLSKVVNEFVANAYTKEFGLDCRALRVSTVIGHGRNTGRSGEASRIVSLAAVGEASISSLAAEQTSAYIYVEDVADLMVRLCFAEGLTRNVYMCPTNRASMGEIITTTKKLLPDAMIDIAPDAITYVQANHFDAGILEKDLNYKLPSLEQRLRDQINKARAERQMPPIG